MDYHGYFLLLSLFVVRISTEDLCDEDGGWLESDGSCYYISSTIEETEVTWHEAHAWCGEQGGDLISIHTFNETELVYEMADAEEYEGDIWIGLNQLQGQESYTWSDETVSEHTDWISNHPIDDGLNQCAYQRGIPISECVELENNINSIRGVLYYPSDADFIDTFYFGYTYGGWTECRDACAEYSRCRSFAFFQPGYYDYITWNWYSYMCAGRSDFINARVPEAYVTSGFVEECEAEGSWRSANCGLKKGFVCKKPPGDVTPRPIITPTPVVPGHCPEGYFGVDNKCFLMVAGVHGDSWTWKEARQICKTAPNGDLATLQTPEQNAAITSRLQDFSLSYWIGYYEDRSQWIWADNSQPVFENWAADTPGSGTEDCAEIWTEGEGAGRWSRRGCGDWRGYICQVYKDEDNIIETPPNTTPNTCSEGWIPYWYACYWVETTSLTWEEAQTRCHDKDSELVSFVAAAENAAVSLMMADQMPYWVGLRKSSEDLYGWEDGWPLIYTNWAAGQPGDGAGFVSVDGEGRWSDIPSGQHHPSICKTTSVPAPTTPVHIEGTCVGSNWIPYGSHCYWFSSSTASSWEDARVSCISHGNVYHTDATLASIHSAAENTFIRQNAREANLYYDPWIGLHRKDADSQFEWTDGSTVDFVAWGPGEPNDDDGTQLCVESYVHTWPGLWNDHLCTDWSRTYVCKASKVLNPTSIPTTPPDVPGTCPGDSWIHYDKYCYLFEPNGYESWNDAQIECIRQGGQDATLASIHSAQENYFVLQKLMEYNSFSASTWIGLNKPAVAGSEWKWSDGSVFVYDNWAVGEPSDIDGTENCVEMYIGETHAEKGAWNDVPCHDIGGYVCKILKGHPPDFFPTTEANEEDKPPNGDSGLSTGDVIGIVFGVFLGVALIGGAAFGVWYFFLPRGKTTSTSNGSAGFTNRTYADLDEDFDDMARKSVVVLEDV